MKTILLFGAGKSATSLIEYLGNCCRDNNWKLLVCDSDLALATSKTQHLVAAQAISMDVSKEENRNEWIAKADLVISMLPAALHFMVAKSCVDFSKSLLTASYIDDNIRSLESQIVDKGILFLGEMGLDPGIDHMSAMKIIDSIKQQGGIITSFISHCGGLVAPESDDNPWHYKITWNPANVVSAGRTGAVYKKEGTVVTINYEDVFNQPNQMIDIPSLFPLAWYANRDSLSYLETYGLENIQTFIRTTLRYPSFCEGWNQLIQLDLTNIYDEEAIQHCTTFHEWFQFKLNKLTLSSGSHWNKSQFLNSDFLAQIDFLEIRSEKALPPSFTSSASLLQYVLEKNLAIQPHDKDMIVMLHELEYELNAQKHSIKSCLIVKGDDSLHTAMAKTVGLPLGIAAKLILQHKIQLKGLHIPVIPEIYNPVIEELKQNGIEFIEEAH